MLRIINKKKGFSVYFLSAFKADYVWDVCCESARVDGDQKKRLLRSSGKETLNRIFGIIKN
jgi:hypothetical protein